MQYLELFKDGFDSTVDEKIKPENRPYVGYSPNDGVIYSTILNNWVVAFPKIKVAGDDKIYYLGGPINAGTYNQLGYPTHINNQLIYADLEGLEGYTANNSDGTVLALQENASTHGLVINENDYVLSKHLHFLKVVLADNWYTFTAPYNIEEISVIETSAESEISAETNKSKMLKMQAESNLNMLYELIKLINTDNEKLSSDVTLEDLLANENIRAVKTPLKHYNGTNSNDDNHGTNIFQSNYYLYELDPSILHNGEFSTDDTGEDLDIQWVPVKRNAGEPLMYAGKTYAVQFPYCPMCNDLNTRDYNDYWSNKIIHFYGSGPLTICGAAQQSDILEKTPSVDHALLTGNYTLKDYILPSGYINELDPNSGNLDMFVLKTNLLIKPAQGYMLYSPNNDLINN